MEGKDNVDRDTQAGTYRRTLDHHRWHRVDAGRLNRHRFFAAPIWVSTLFELIG